MPLVFHLLQRRLCQPQITAPSATVESLQFVVIAFGLARVKPVRLSNHAQRYASKRGFTTNEVEEAVRTAPWRQAELGRLECRKDFAYQNQWNGKVYATKQVRPVFEEATEIVVVTVYTYYF